MPVAARDSQYGTRAVGHRRQWHGRHTLRSARRRPRQSAWSSTGRPSPDTAHWASSTRSGGLRLRGIRGLRERRSEEDDVISIARFMTRSEKP